jgi:hypothetical protein
VVGLVRQNAPRLEAVVMVATYKAAARFSEVWGTVLDGGGVYRTLDLE